MEDYTNSIVVRHILTKAISLTICGRGFIPARADQGCFKQRYIKTRFRENIVKKRCSSLQHTRLFTHRHKLGSYMCPVHFILYAWERLTESVNTVLAFWKSRPGEPKEHVSVEYWNFVSLFCNTHSSLLRQRWWVFFYHEVPSAIEESTFVVAKKAEDSVKLKLRVISQPTSALQRKWLLRASIPTQTGNLRFQPASLGAYHYCPPT